MMYACQGMMHSLMYVMYLIVQAKGGNAVRNVINRMAKSDIKDIGKYFKYFKIFI